MIKSAISFVCVGCDFDKNVIFTLDKNIHTPKCSRDNPRFNLTVANSNKKPSKALRRKDKFLFQLSFNTTGTLSLLWSDTTPSVLVLFLPSGREDGSSHLAQQPQWNVWDWSEGNSRAPVRSPVQGQRCAGSKRTRHAAYRTKARATSTWGWSYLLGERRGPAAARLG